MSIMDTLMGKAQSTLNNLVGGNSVGTTRRLPDLLDGPAVSRIPEGWSDDYAAQIVCNDLGIKMIAQLPDTWQFDISSEYSAPYAEGLTEGVPSMLAPGLKAAGISLTTQVLTAQLWKGSSEINFTLPLVFQAENDPDREIMKPLLELMYLTLPRDSQGGGGMLSAPGPHFDLVDTSPEGLNSGKAEDKSVAGNSSIKDSIGNLYEKGKALAGPLGDAAVSAAGVPVAVLQAGSDGGASVKRAVTNVYQGLNKTISPISNMLASLVKNRISLSIGNMITFDSVVITNVQQNHKVQPSADINGLSLGLYQRCEVTVTFKTFFTPTQRDLIKMFPSAPIATDNIRQKTGGW